MSFLTVTGYPHNIGPSTLLLSTMSSECKQTFLKCLSAVDFMWDCP